MLLLTLLDLNHFVEEPTPVKENMKNKMGASYGSQLHRQKQATRPQRPSSYI